MQNHPSSPVQKFHHRHGRSTNGDCVQALPNVSEALDRRVGLAEQCGIVGAERRTSQADLCPPVDSSRVAIKLAVALKASHFES